VLNNKNLLPLRDHGSRFHMLYVIKSYLSLQWLHWTSGFDDSCIRLSTV